MRKDTIDQGKQNK